MTAIINLGPAIVTLSDKQVYSRKTMRENPVLSILMDVVMMRSQDESILKTVRSKGAWTTKRENALTKPMTARGPAWLDPVMEKVHTAKGDKFVCTGFAVNEEKAKVVQDIYKRASQGKSLDGITKALNGLGIKPITVSKKGSKFWYRQQVSRFLSSKSVIGTHEPWTATYERDENDEMQMIKTKEEEIPNYYPPIIDKELAEKVWALGNTRVAFKGTGRASFITSGISKCVNCGNTMTYNVKGRYRYIICSNRRVNACTNKKLTVYDRIERILLHELPEVLESHSVKDEDTNLTDLKGALEEVELEIGRVMDAIRIRGFDSTIGHVLDSLEAQRKAIRSEMDKTSQRASKSFLENGIQSLISAIRSGETIPEINQHMRLVFKSLVIKHAEPRPDREGTPAFIALTLVDGSQTFIAF